MILSVIAVLTHIYRVGQGRAVSRRLSLAQDKVIRLCTNKIPASPQYCNSSWSISLCRHWLLSGLYVFTARHRFFSGIFFQMLHHVSVQCFHTWKLLRNVAHSFSYFRWSKKMLKIVETRIRGSCLHNSHSYDFRAPVPALHVLCTVTLKFPNC